MQKSRKARRPEDDARRQGASYKKWTAEYDQKFMRQRGGLGKEMAKRVDGAIDDLLASERARDPRDRKGIMNVDGTPTIVYGCRVGKSYRIMYCVRGDCIRFMRVGDHKTVYGRD